MHRAKHGAFCLALISNTRYPSAGKGHNRICYSQVKILLAFAERHQPGFSKHFCALFCSSSLRTSSTIPLASYFHSSVGFEPTIIGVSQNILTHFTLALQLNRLCYRKRSSDIRFGTPRASRWFFMHSLEVPCKHILPPKKSFFTKKKLRNHIIPQLF